MELNNDIILFLKLQNKKRVYMTKADNNAET